MLRFRMARFSRLPTTTADCRISGNVVAIVVAGLAKAAMVGGGSGGGGGRIFMIVGSTALADDSRPGQEVVFLIFLLLFLLLITPANDRTIFNNVIGPESEFTTISKTIRGCFDYFELKRSALPTGMCNSEKTVFRNLNDTPY
jgi:hypothetical protein